MVAGILEKSKRFRKAVLFVAIQKTPKCRPGNPSRNFVPATSFSARTPKHATAVCDTRRRSRLPSCRLEMRATRQPRWWNFRELAPRYRREVLLKFQYQNAVSALRAAI